MRINSELGQGNVILNEINKTYINLKNSHIFIDVYVPKFRAPN